MANTKSALKEIRKGERRRVRNRIIRVSTRTAVKHARQAVDEGDSSAQDEVKRASSLLDKAAQKGAIHKNAAARRKSRLARKARTKD